jgi:hypothetical protein
MKILRGINTSAAIIALVCFFLPWVQVSCAGARNTMSGLDLARDGHGSLWFVSVLMGALVLSTIVRVRREQHAVLSFASTLCGLISAYLMNQERLRVHKNPVLFRRNLRAGFGLASFRRWQLLYLESRCCSSDSARLESTQEGSLANESANQSLPSLRDSNRAQLQLAPDCGAGLCSH